MASLSAEEPRDGVLEDTVARHIIPKLIEVHWTPEAGCADVGLPPTAEEIALLARVAVERDMSAVLELLLEISARGLTLETLLLELIAPAARHIGDRWLRDEISFVDVTVSLGLFQRLVQATGRRLVDGGPLAPPQGLVILLGAPGEQHTLALYILAELLRTHGWEVHLDPQMNEATLLSEVRAQHVAAVGFTVSDEQRVARLNLLIARARRAARNRAMLALVGGRVDPKGLKGALFCADVRAAPALLTRALQQIKPPVKTPSAKPRLKARAR